jgi:hypothetical protein
MDAETTKERVMAKEFYYFVFLQGDSNKYNCNGLVYGTWAKNRAEAEEIAACAVTVYNGQYLEAKPASKCRVDLYDVFRLKLLVECYCVVCGRTTGQHEWQDRRTNKATYCGCNGPHD